MAWSVIADSVLQVGRPIRALTMRLLRDNITALANGDAGAPKVQRAAIQERAVDSLRIEFSTIKAENMSSGLDMLYYVMGMVVNNSYLENGSLVWAERVASPGLSQAITYGATYAGSDLRVAGLAISGGVVTMTSSGSLSGTYRALGNCAATVEKKQTLFIRIA